MSAQILDGRKIADEIRSEIQDRVQAHLAAGRRAPRIDVIRVGMDPASEVYVRMKENAARKAGMEGVQHHLDADTTAEDLYALIDALNQDDAVDAVLLQLPLPAHLDEAACIGRILPSKDVDGFHVENIGRLVRGERTIEACTPAGVMELIRRSGVALEGARALVVGRSNIVGKPVALLLLQANATVTIAHSRTRDLAALVSESDIVVAAVGRPACIQGEWIKPGAVVIDVGVNRLPDKTLAGDVAFDSAAQKAGWITPVPGGVGPMTITYLLQNTLDLYEASLR